MVRAARGAPPRMIEGQLLVANPDRESRSMLLTGGPAPAPAFLSPRFHARFFPSLVWRRLRNRISVERAGTRPSFEAFRLGVFGFFLVLGVTLGLALGSGLHGWALKALAAADGLLAGYLLGIAAGLGVQYLGWVGAWIERAAGLGAVGLVFVDLVLVLG